MDKLDWFIHDRFGMIIHFGLYSQIGKDCLIKSINRMSDEEYDEYFKTFNPKDCNPSQWAKLAKEAGMKYAIFTSKHHDGFCLFDSKYTDYKITNTPFKRDLVKEYVEAFRAEGIKIGLYYSVIDWHHPDYPHYGDRHHPMRDNEEYKDYQFNFENYKEYLHNQIKELCTNYGKIDIFWFDYSYKNMLGETWGTDEILNILHKYQPEAIMDSRLDGNGRGYGTLMTDNPAKYAGDFVSPEQIIPPKPLYTPSGKPVPWECTTTLNNYWGYHPFDHEYKSSDTLIKKLVDCVSKGGNFTINLGPDGNGRIPREEITILKEIGAWMNENNESIYGCGPCKLENIGYRYTQNGKNIYLHITEQPIGSVPILGINENDIKRITQLATNSELKVSHGWTIEPYPEYTFISLGENDNHTYKMYDQTDTVIKIELK